MYAEGTVVSIDPKVTEGINIADITVDGQTTSLYGGSATIGGLTDVDITNPTEGEELSYDDTAEKWVNRITRIECTMAQYQAWEQGGTLLPDVEYYVTDAPSSEGVVIDDTTPSASTVYSSNKVDNLLSGKANIENLFFGDAGVGFQSLSGDATLDNLIDNNISSSGYFSINHGGYLTGVTTTANRQFIYGWVNANKLYSWCLICSFGGIWYGKRENSSTYTTSRLI